ncbi:sulfurtransferase complex subunit TusD [Ferrimonas sediminicola]|uniref:Sulfurtransferase complex subunit TusD n=1 Tax=Ferrimonas sediminicola TaxID=2569538 RepID=A0A4U1BD94_9GAMM|nr:sulfurtransferase complex subunit TusD [Ferrimonas sediminicola]TKB48536.1 sulfurtransferase complex subunit TusD [Ferrimonas sediminicola]
MSSFLVVVNGEPYGSHSSWSALKFCETLLKQGHTLEQVFFYQHGVLNASRLLMPASDELNLAQRWQSLHQQHQVPLISCVSAGLRRGVIDAEAAEDGGLDSANLASPFILGGLGELVTTMQEVDRTVQF